MQHPLRGNYSIYVSYAVGRSQARIQRAPELRRAMTLTTDDVVAAVEEFNALRAKKGATVFVEDFDGADITHEFTGAPEFLVDRS